MKDTIRAPARKSAITPRNIPRRTGDEGHNIRSRSELCFPIIRTFEPKSEPPMSDKQRASQK